VNVKLSVEYALLLLIYDCSETRLLRRIPGPKRQEVPQETAGPSQYAPNIKQCSCGQQKRIGWDGQIARKEVLENGNNILQQKLKCRYDI
jgi:hypothetical protein